MATTPTAVTANTTSTHPVNHWINLVKAHEKLIITVIIALVLWHYGNKAYDAYGKHLDAQVKADNAQIAQIEKQNEQNAITLQQLAATVAAQAKIDDAKIAAAKQTIIVKQQTDAALPLPELSKHWADMLSLQPAAITPQPNGTVAVTTDAAHATVNELEKLGPLTDQLAATQDQLKGCTNLSAQKDTTITGLQADVVAKTKKIDDDSKQAKHDIRHAYLKGLKHGIIIGVVGTTAAFVAIFK
jgi:hypothetical protein